LESSLGGTWGTKKRTIRENSPSIPAAARNETRNDCATSSEPSAGPTVQANAKNKRTKFMYSGICCASMPPRSIVSRA
jgi:hypothetical protein